MIDTSLETPLSLSQAAKLPNLPIRRNGKRPHVATIWRWCQAGVRGIRLESIVCGGVRCTTAEAIARFFQRLTEARDGTTPTVPIVTSRAHRAAVRRAEAVLDRAGI